MALEIKSSLIFPQLPKAEHDPNQEHNVTKNTHHIYYHSTWEFTARQTEVISNGKNDEFGFYFSKIICNLPSE